jgi:hypothetical protein
MSVRALDYRPALKDPIIARFCAPGEAWPELLKRVASLSRTDSSAIAEAIDSGLFAPGGQVMRNGATNSVYNPGAKRFWFPSAANACRVVPLAAHSPGSPAQLDYDRQREADAAAGGPGFRIFATVSQRGS